VLFGLPRIPQLSLTQQRFISAGCVYIKQTHARFSVFMGVDAEVALGMLCSWYSIKGPIFYTSRAF